MRLFDRILEIGGSMNNQIDIKVLDKEGTEILLEKMGSILSKYEEITLAYAFGSFLRGEFRDIDIAVLLGKDFAPYKAMKFAMKVGREIEKELGYSYEIDVKVLNHSPVHFQNEVINTGRVIFCRDEKKRLKFEARVLSKYLDYRNTGEWFKRIRLRAEHG